MRTVTSLPRKAVQVARPRQGISPESYIDVWPRNDDMRKLLKHPFAGAFRPFGHARWPNDSWTARLVLDGDLLLKEPRGTPQHDDKPAEPDHVVEQTLVDEPEQQVFVRPLVTK